MHGQVPASRQQNFQHSSVLSEAIRAKVLSCNPQEKVVNSQMVNLLPDVWSRDTVSSMESAWGSYLKVDMEIGDEKEKMPTDKLDDSELLFHIRQFDHQDCRIGQSILINC
jgi:hypothetical protein